VQDADPHVAHRPIDAQVIAAPPRTSPTFARRRRARRASPRSSASARRAWVPPDPPPTSPTEPDALQALASFDTLQLVALAASLGWASGLRLYAVLFIVGGLATSTDRAAAGLAVLSHPLSCRRRASCASSSSSPTRSPRSIRCGMQSTP
jgi:hypothetical protein